MERAQDVPLHRRRHQAKHRDADKPLTDVDTARSFCDHLVRRLQHDPAQPSMGPLLVRTADTARAALATDDALDHLQQLYRLVDQLFALKDHNAKLQRRVRDMDHIRKLREMHLQIENEITKSKQTDPDAFFRCEATSMDMAEEYEYTETLLESMLAAGRNASLKRAKWKGSPGSKLRQSLVRSQRSRSMGGEELEDFSTHLAVPKRPTRRRGSDSANKGDKSKISKWTRVKAAFKWEKAHTGIAPVEVIAQTKPTLAPPATGISPLTPTSPLTSTVTTDSLSSAVSSDEDLPSLQHDAARRSASLDAATILDQDNHDTSAKSSHKTPWSKMKDIIQTRKDSVRKKQNRSSIRSSSGGRTSECYQSDTGGTLSHSESAEIIASIKDKVELQSFSDTKRTTPTLTVTMPSSEELTTSRFPPIKHENQHKILTKQNSLDMPRKVRHSTTATAHDSSDPDSKSPVVQRRDSKWKKVKKAFLTSPASTPSSPSRHSAFFSYEPEDIAMTKFRDEITENRSKKDFKEASGESAENTRASSSSPKRTSRKKSNDWNIIDTKDKSSDWPRSKGLIQNNNSSSGSPFAIVPTHAQLSEDFKKKLDEWKKLKATNSVPTYTGEDHEDKSKIKKIQPKKEVLVKTGAGFFRFEGISRSFTRKLHEWEKSKGIAPEVSTTALLRESLARPPLPVPRSLGYDKSLLNYPKIERNTLRLQRSHSVGSVREDAAPHVSTSASSLSLNNLDECNDIDQQCSDFGDESFDTYTEGKTMGSESDSDGGPGAMIIEIEDEIEETAAPLMACMPCVDPQTPVYRYGQAQERHLACENTDGKNSPVSQVLMSLPRACVEKMSTLQTSVDLLLQEETVLHKLLTGKRNVTERYNDVLQKIEAVKSQSSKTISEIKNMERRLDRLKKEEDILRNSLQERFVDFNAIFVKFDSHVNDFKISLRENNVCSTETIDRLLEKIDTFIDVVRTRASDPEKSSNDSVISNLTEISRELREIQNDQLKFNIRKTENNIQVTYVMSKQANQDQANTNMFAEQTESKGAIKKVKDSTESKSNSTKRKVKTRQMVEREKSIPTESDSDNDANTITMEFPKRKKGFLKNNKNSESRTTVAQENFEKQSNTDSGDNVFVVQLKSNVQNKEKSKKEILSTDVVIKEYDNSMGIIIPLSISSEDMHTSTNAEPEIFVKTTRKIFSPVRRDSNGETQTVIGFDLEELARSVKNNNRDKNYLPDVVNTYNENDPLRSHSPSPSLLRRQIGGANALPPLPPSPPTSRHKETAPSIRIMIQKYNMKLNEEGDTKTQSGSNTPPWRSPRSQERFLHETRRSPHLRNNPFINGEVQKSASTSHILRDQTRYDNENKTSDPSLYNTRVTTTPPLPKKMMRGVLKSSSAGSLKTTLPSINSKVEQTKNDTEKKETPKVDDKIDMGIYGKKIDPNLLRLVKSSSCVPMQEIQPSHSPSSRALRIKRAKEQFLAAGSDLSSEGYQIRKDRNTSSNVDLVENRLSQISFDSDVSYEGLTKSASLGIIGEPQPPKSEDDRSSSHKPSSRFGLSNLASKFKKVRMRTKNAKSDNRQSMVVELPHGELNRTDRSIVMAGRTGSAVAVNNQQIFSRQNQPDPNATS